MDAEERRKEILRRLEASPAPLSGAELARSCAVSRQVVVQDIALLRREVHPIVGTHTGYVRRRPEGARRLIKCHHTADELEDEMDTVVDLGATMEDVFVNHRTYGVIRAHLGCGSRREVASFVDGIRSGHSTPLMLVTSGYHFHHISAPSEEILDEVERALADKGYLVPLDSYERETLS